MTPLRYDIISDHIIKDRFGRFEKILEIGYDSVIAEIVDEMNPTRIQHITDTGILFITAERPDGKIILVTGFLITIEKLTAIYKGKRIPQSLYNTVIKNRRKYSYLYNYNK